MSRLSLLRPVLLVALVVATLSAACGGTTVTAAAAAEVNGQAISQDTLEAELDAIRGNATYLEFLESQGNQVLGSGQGTFSADFVRRVLTRQIYLELVRQELVRRKLQVSDDDIAAVTRDVANEVGGPDVFDGFTEGYRDTLLRRRAEVAAVQLALSDLSVDEAAMRTFYDENAELFSETCVSHILFAVIDDHGDVDTEATEARSADLLAEAQAAKARVAAGESFAALAPELSKDASNKDQGGDLGCGPAGRFVPEFETAMDATPAGQVSEPVQTQFGFHLLHVTSRGTKPFEEVTEEIRQRLLGDASQSFGLFLTDAISEADIEVNPRFGTFSKNTQNPSVVAPNAPTTQPVGGPVSPTEIPTDLGR